MLGAILSVGGSLLGGLMQSNSAKKAVQAKTQMQREAIAAQQEAARKVQELQAPGVGLYNQGVNALTGRVFGSGTSDGNDWGDYLSRYTDVQAEYDRIQADPARRADLQSKGVYTPEQFAQLHYQTHGTRPDENRTVNALTGQPTGPGTPAGTFGNTENPTYEATTYTPPPAFSFDIESFKDNPAYKFALEQGSGQVMANASATGALQSGAALKALQDRGQKTAYNFYAPERDFAFRAYTDSRDFGRSTYENDRNFGRATYESDRNYLTGRYDRSTDDMFRMTGIGQNALNATSNALVGAGNATATGLENIGNAQAGGHLQQGNIWGGVVGDVTGALAGLIKGNALNGDLRKAAAANPFLF
jgi:hypothetical protein